MLSRFIVLIVALLLSSSLVPAQEKKAPVPRYAIISTWEMMHPQLGIFDFSRLEKFVAKNILPAEKEAWSLLNDGPVYSPRRDTIGQFLLILQRQNNVVFLDVEHFAKNNELIAINQSFVVTPKIVEFANSIREKSDGKVHLKVPDGQIAVINTDLIWDAQTGVRRLVALVQEHGNRNEVCKKTKACAEIGQAIKRFAVKKGFGLIFDRSRPLPEAIRPFPLTDQTDEFIAELQEKK